MSAKQIVCFNNIYVSPQLDMAAGCCVWPCFCGEVVRVLYSLAIISLMKNGFHARNLPPPPPPEKSQKYRVS